MLAQSGLDAAQRFGVAASVAVGVAVLLAASVVLSVLRSLVTFGNLVLRRDADVLHLEHGLLRRREHTFDMRRLRGGTLREPLLVRLFGGARLDAVMTGVDGAGEASLLLPPCPAQTARAVLAELIARPDAVTGPLRGHGPVATRRRWTRALILPAILGLALVVAAIFVAGAGLGVAGLGGADRVLRAAGGRPVRDRWATGWATAGSSRAPAAWSAAATASPPPGSSAGRCARRSFSAAPGVATLIAATAAGVKATR